MKKRLHVFLTLFLALVVQLSFAQVSSVTGTVTGEEGLSLPGVNVIVQGTNTGAQTDFDGKYSVAATSGDVLVFSYVGFETQQRVVGTSNVINVTLAVDAAALDEVIVVGYGTATKQSFTGTATKIDGEQLSQKNVSNVSQALAGESAGVRVINSSGQPGTSATVRIRGIGSVNGNTSPLYVLDGVPYNGNINAINPQDIATTTILKDAAATAIYGARGANGVIVITTKRGRAGFSSIEVSTKTGVNVNLLPRYDVIKSADDYTGLAWEGLFNRGVATGQADAIGYANARLFSSAGISPQYNLYNVEDGGELIDPDTRMVRDGVTRKYDPENWEDFGFQNSIRTEANLKISGGSDKTSYYSSFGYLNDVGYIIDSDFERFSGRLNVTHEVKDWLSGSVNLGYTLSETNNNGQSEDSGSIFWFADNIPSIYPLFLRDENGDFVPDPIYGGNQYDYGTGRGFGGLTNSIADAIYSGSNSKRHEINSNAFLKADVTDWMSIETRFGMQYYNDSYNSSQNPFYGPSSGQGGSIYKEKTELFSYNMLELIRFNKSFGASTFELLAAHESTAWERQTLFVSKNNLVNPDGTELNNAVVVSSPPGSYVDDYTIESFFSQLNYDFDNKYFLSGTVRRDGSSRFTKNKWDTFGSLGLAWVISNEGFMQNQSIFSNLKLKASYGLIGEQGGVGFYPGFDSYTIGNLNDQPSFSFDTKGNPDLTWETSKMFQVGVEFSLSKYLDVTVDYYRKNTEDLLFDKRIAPSRGFAILKVNDGELLNQGIEFDVIGHLLKTKDAFIDLRINGEILKNELLALPIDSATGLEKVLDVDGRFGRTAGKSLFDFYIREWAGVDPADGTPMWYQYYFDADGNGQLSAGEGIGSLTEYLNANPENEGSIDRTITKSYANATQKFVDKSAFPDVRGAFSLDAGFKGFTLSAQFLYQIGGYSYDAGYANLMSNTNVGGNNFHKDIFDRWQQPGDITDVPRLSDNFDTNVASTSTRFVTKADYLALNNIRLGYSIPKEIANGLGMNEFSIFLTGDNLFLLSERDGFNPSTAEAGTSDIYNYSPLSTFTAGVRINF